MSVEESRDVAVEDGMKHAWRQRGFVGDAKAAWLAIAAFFPIMLRCRPVYIQLSLTAGFSLWAWLRWHEAFPVLYWVWFIVIQCFGFVVECINTAFERSGDSVAAKARHDRLEVEILRSTVDPAVAAQLERLNDETYGPMPPDDGTMPREQRLLFNKHSKAIKDAGAAVTVGIAILAFSVEPWLILHG